MRYSGQADRALGARGLGLCDVEPRGWLVGDWKQRVIIFGTILVSGDNDMRFHRKSLGGGLLQLIG